MNLNQTDGSLTTDSTTDLNGIEEQSSLSGSMFEEMKSSALEAPTSKSTIETPSFLDFSVGDPLGAPKLERAADALNEAMNGGLTGIGTDEDAVIAILKDKSEDERKQIEKIFETKYGTSLRSELDDEMDGAELDQALRLLDRKDGKADDAGRIHTALVERGQVLAGRTDENVEKDIRDTLSTMNSQQIADLDRNYQERYGTNSRNALQQNPDLSEATKQAAEIYLRGTDKRTDADTLKLSDIALSEKNMDMFEEAFRNSSPTGRQQFLEDGGDQKILQAFGVQSHGSFSPRKLIADTDVSHAAEYARTGELSSATQIDDNTSWLGDNEKAINKTLTRLSDSERGAYISGHQLATRGADSQTEDSQLTAREKHDLSFYRQMHEKLESAGNATEVAAWEDLIQNKDGSLVSKLAAHRGSIYDDGMDSVLSDIENMSRQDWERLKSSPENRRQVESTLATFLSDDELARAHALLDEKTSASSFERSEKTGRRDVLATLEDNTGFFNDNETNIYDALQRMTPQEQQRYRTDKDFRHALQTQVEAGLDVGPEREAARWMLQQINEGQQPRQDVIVKLLQNSSDLDTDQGQALRDLRRAIKEDPSIVARINSSDPADGPFRLAFNNAVERAFDAEQYERYVKPLLTTGTLPLETQMELNRNLVNDDEKGTYDDLLAAEPGEKSLLLDKDPNHLTARAYRETVLGHLSPDERQLALVTLEQGKMLPEDRMRSYMLGAGTEEKEIKDLLGSMDVGQKAQLKNDYAEKYGDLNYDLVDELGGIDKDVAEREIAPPPADARDQFNAARDEYYKSRDGVGKEWVDVAWDGTGFQTDEALNRYAAAMARASGDFQDLSADQQEPLKQNVISSLDQFKESKGAAADTAVDGTIGVVAVGGAFFTEGVSLSLLAYTGAAGAVFKTGTKALVQGDDYDWTSAQLPADLTSGFADAAGSFVGPGSLAALFKVGEKAGGTAAKLAVSELSAEGGEALLKEGAEATLTQELSALMRNAIASGNMKVDNQAIAEVARTVAAHGQEELVAAAIKRSMAEAIETEASQSLKNAAAQYGLVAGAGGTGGGISGAVYSSQNWDSSASLEDNVAMVAEGSAQSAAIGAAAAIGFNGAFQGARKGAAMLREGSGREPVAALTEKGTNAEPTEAARANAANETSDGKRQIFYVTDDLEGLPPESFRNAPTNESASADDLPAELRSADDRFDGFMPAGQRPAAGSDPDIHDLPTEIKPISVPAAVDLPTVNDRRIVPQQAADLHDLPTEVRKNPLETVDDNITTVDERTVAVDQPADIHDLPTAVQAENVHWYDNLFDWLEGSPHFDEPTLTDQPALHEMPTQVRDVPTESLDQPPVAGKHVDLEWNDSRGVVEVGAEGLANHDAGSQMKFIVDGKQYTLERSGVHPAFESEQNLVEAATSDRVGLLEGDQFYYGKRTREVDTFSKIHVTGRNADDLARLQEILIPALNDDPALQDMIGAWKTLDPRYGVGPVDGLGQEPGAMDQAAKAFTIYPKDRAQTEAIAERIDQILAEHREVILDQPMATGNVDIVPEASASRRVGVVREAFTASADSTPDAPLYQLDETVQSQIEGRFTITEQPLMAHELRQVESQCGLRPGTLAYDNQGKLVVRGTGSERYYPNGLLYVTEGNASKVPGDLTDRPALYALYQMLGLDPVAFN